MCNRKKNLLFETEMYNGHVVLLRAIQSYLREHPEAVKSTWLEALIGVEQFANYQTWTLPNVKESPPRRHYDVAD